MTEQNTPAPEVKPGEQATGAVKPETIPYDRFKEVNDRLKAAEARAAEMEAAQEKARKEQLEKQGEYKTLLDEATQKLAGVIQERDAVRAKWDNYESGRRQALIEELPEEMREKYSSHDITVLEDIVALAKKQTAAPGTPPDHRPANREKAVRSVVEASEALLGGKITPDEYRKLTQGLKA